MEAEARQAGGEDVDRLRKESITMQRHKLNNFIFTILLISILFLISDAFAGWETGVKAGYDSNVDRAIDSSISDTYAGGFLSFTRDSGEEPGVGWSLNVSLEGAGYKQSTYLNYGTASIKPSVVFHPHARWMVCLSPFARSTIVKDEEQSAVGIGGEFAMKQLLSSKYYLGEYLVYTDSSARVDIYSYKEKTAGIYAGANWTGAFWSEAGYEYSRGDSFLAVGDVVTTVTGSILDNTNQAGQNGAGQAGRGQYGNGGSIRYSQTYNEYILNEPVNRGTLGINMGYRFSRRVFSFLNYAYTTIEGDTGTSRSHSGTIGLGFNF